MTRLPHPVVQVYLFLVLLHICLVCVPFFVIILFYGLPRILRNDKTQVSYISDDENPKLENLPQNISVTSFIDKAYAKAYWREPSATDNSDVVTLSSNFKPGSKFFIGTTYVTYTAVDASGNTVKHAFTVTVTGKVK